MPAQSRRQKINEAGLLSLVRQGVPVLVAEYRSTKVDQVKWTDKATGKAQQFVKVEHHLEADVHGTGQIEAFVCEERQARELDNPALVHIGLVKGQTVALRLLSIRQEKGHTIASVDGLNGVAVVE